MQRSLSLLILFSLTFLTACEKANIKAGERSLEGDWLVTNINSAFGERTANGISIAESTEESGVLGSFVFSENEVVSSYTRLDTLYENTSTWQLQREKVNEGFFKVERYTLVLENQIFTCEFGDQTKNAERNATQLRLIFETTNIGAHEQFILTLEKE